MDITLIPNLPLTSTGTFNIIPGQNQYFKFLSSSFSETAKITLSNVIGNPDVFIYDSTYNLIASNTANNNPTTWTAIPGTSYYVKIYGVTDVNYTISKNF